jgi:hypothetical protein
MYPLTSLSPGGPSHLQADQKSGAGAISLDLELLKPLRVAAVASDWLERAGAPDTVWLEYAYSKYHPVLQYLPTKLAEWIGENMQEELGFPDREDQHKWSVSELNNILCRHVCGERPKWLRAAHFRLP